MVTKSLGTPCYHWDLMVMMMGCSQTRYLLSRSHISTTVLFLHLNSNETYGVRWELHKDANLRSKTLLNSCFTATYLPSEKLSKYWWTLRGESKEELINEFLLWTPKQRHTSVSRLVKVYIRQLCGDTECYQEDLLSAVADRDGWRERVIGICSQHALMLMMMRMCPFFQDYHNKHISKLTDRSWGWPEGSLFQKLLHQRVECYFFLWIAPLILDPHLVMSSVKQGGIKYHLL